MTDAQTQHTNLTKYIKLYATAYTVLSLLVFAALQIFDFEGGGAVSAVVVIAAAQLPIYYFVKDHHRVLTKPERRKLIWICLGLTFAISIILSIVITTSALLYEFGMQGITEFFDGLFSAAATEEGHTFIYFMIFGLALTILLTYLSLLVVFSFMGKQFLKGFEKQRGQS